jgi:hypothetical protein
MPRYRARWPSMTREELSARIGLFERLRWLPRGGDLEAGPRSAISMRAEPLSRCARSSLSPATRAAFSHWRPSRLARDQDTASAGHTSADDRRAPACRTARSGAVSAGASAANSPHIAAAMRAAVKTWADHAACVNRPTGPKVPADYACLDECLRCRRSVRPRLGDLPSGTASGVVAQNIRPWAI